MKYFVLSAIFFVNILAFGFFVYTKQKIKKNMINSLLTDLFQAKQNHNLHLSLFQNSLTHLVTDLIYKAPKKEQEQIIDDLKKHHHQKLQTYLIKKSPIVRWTVNQLFSKKAFSLPKKIKAKTLSDQLALCLIYESNFCYQMLSDTLSKMPKVILSARNRYLKKLFEARAAFLKTDLKKASELLFKNIKHFHAHDLYEEQAYTYFMLGEIYRVCGLFDPADMMFRTSSQIYQKAGHFYGTKFILSSYAFNCLQANRLEEAESCFIKALSSFKKQKDSFHEAEILNQLALLSNINMNSKKAQRLASRALKNHLLFTNQNGIAFSYEQLALAHFHMKNFKLSQKYALKAKKIYEKQKNVTAQNTLLNFLDEIKKTQASL